MSREIREIKILIYIKRIRKGNQIRNAILRDRLCNSKIPGEMGAALEAVGCARGPGMGGGGAFGVTLTLRPPRRSQDCPAKAARS